MTSFATTHKTPYSALTTAIAGKPLSSKSILITGASKGVGIHITRGLAAAGPTRIGLLSRSKASLEAIKSQLSAQFPDVALEIYAADITNEAEIANVFQAFGAPDVLVNNAGDFPDDAPFIDQDLKRWWKGFEINILGSAIVTQQFLKAKGPTKHATVLSTSTLAAHFRYPLKGWSGYNASKLGALRMFEYLRFESEEVDYINIHPGFLDTDGFQRSGGNVPPDGLTSGELVGQFFAWAATEDAKFLRGRFVWAEWDIDELKARANEISEKDLLLSTIEGFKLGM